MAESSGTFAAMGPTGPGTSADTACAAVLRQAVADDVAWMAAIEHTEGGHGRWDIASFREELRCTWSYTWVMQDPHGRGVAFFVIWRVADEAHLLNIAVDVTWRRRGLGRTMLAHLRSWARAQGLATILLELRQHNTAALRLYESCGFVVNGRRAAYYAETGEDALLMECVL